AVPAPGEHASALVLDPRGTSDWSDGRANAGNVDGWVSTGDVDGVSGACPEDVSAGNDVRVVGILERPTEAALAVDGRFLCTGGMGTLLQRYGTSVTSIVRRIDAMGERARTGAPPSFREVEQLARDPHPTDIVEDPHPTDVVADPHPTDVVEDPHPTDSPAE